MKRILLILLILPAVLFAQSKSLYEQGMEALAQGDTNTAEEYFEESIDEENYAPSYYELAKININEDSWFSFDNARGYLQDAIELDSLNIEYRLLLGRAYELIEKTGWFTQFLRLNIVPREKAIETYRDILKIDPDNETAHSRIANLYEEDYYQNINSMSFIQFEHPDYKWDESQIRHENAGSEAYNQFLNSLVIDGQRPAVYYTDRAIESFNIAAESYMNAIRSEEKTEEPFFRYSLLLCSNSLQDSAVKVAEEGLIYFPNSLNLYLAAGYVNYKIKNYSQAEKWFQSAFKLMNPEELKDYKVNSLFSLFTPEEKSAAENMNDNELESYIKVFWKKRDPLTITGFNERELEHYARLFYVNHYFSVPEKDLKGWQTDRGDIWLRYGEPQKLLNIKRDAEVNGLNASNEGIASLTIYPEAYVMTYDNGRTFSFIDEFNSREFVHSEKTLAGKLGMQFFSDSKDLSEDLRITEPEEYLLKVNANILNLPSSIIQLRNSYDSRKTMLYFSYGMPLSNDTSGIIPVEHIHDISLMDQSFHTIAQVKDTISYAKVTTLNWFDGNKYIFSSTGINANPGNGFLSFEVLRPEDNGIYINHGRFEVRDFSQQKLNISDILLANSVQSSETETASIKRGDLHIIPNPIKTFNRDKPPYIYYEVYNLQKNEKKLTDFEQDITITRKPDDNFVSSAWNSVLSLVGLDSEEKVSLKSNYNTLEADPQVYVQLDLNDHDPGEYVVTVKIKDNLSGQETSSSVELGWE